jgi:magnesium transporter
VKTRKTVHRDMTRMRNISARDIQRSVLFEQELNETISALVHTQNWLQQLMKGNYLKMSEDESELLEDLLIENGQVLDSAKSILKTIQNIRGASEAILTQNLNNTIRMLTAITIVLTIPTLISSLFGMNVILPFRENAHGFWIILSAILATVLATIYFFIRNKWL